MSVSEIFIKTSEETQKKIDRIIDFIDTVKGPIKSSQQRWFSAKEAADYIRVSKSHILRNLINEIPRSQDGRKVAFDKADLDTYWERRKIGGSNRSDQES